MRYAVIAQCVLLGSVTSVTAQVSVGIAVPGVSIGINLPSYPEFVRVPNYPVYYAPQLRSNFFFYDGMYWVYQGDSWYASSWYNGPWGLVSPELVPVFVLRIPVQYYRDPPGYFRDWQPDAPPRWGERWGNEWQQHHGGWDRWNRGSAPAPAPLPVYQRQFSGDRYPRVEQQQELHDQNYRYQPRDAAVRQHDQEHSVQRVPAPTRVPPQHIAQDPTQQPRQMATQREQQPPSSNQKDDSHGRATSQEPKRGQGQEKDRANGDERGQERSK